MIDILVIIYLNIVNDIVYLMDYWEVQVRLIDNDYDTILDTDGCQVGDTTTFQSVAMPELSEEGKHLICFIFELLSSVKFAA